MLNSEETKSETKDEEMPYKRKSKSTYSPAKKKKPWPKYKPKRRRR